MDIGIPSTSKTAKFKGKFIKDIDETEKINLPADDLEFVVGEEDNNKKIVLNRIIYEQNAANDIINTILLDRLKNDVSSKDLKYRVYKCISIVNVKRDVLISRINDIKGKICQYASDTTTIVKEKLIYIIKIDQRKDLTRLHVCIYSENYDDARISLREVVSLFQDLMSKNDTYCELSWLIDAGHEIEERYLREKIDDVLFKEAYPYIDIDKLIDEYLAGDEPILILTGPPGTGKTRLIRYILKKITLSKTADNVNEDSNDNICKALYTCSAKIIEQGKLFIDLLTENYDILVLEDIDDHLRPRTDGNTTMYGMLSSSNGLVVSTIKSKKIVLSTNLPNIDKIDEALTRPGRCYSIVQTRKLTWGESIKFLAVAMCNNSIELDCERKDYALSELYHLLKYGTVNTKYEKIKKVGF
jgi:hypothetical protein